MKYRIIEHTADIGIEAEAAGIDELFECSAEAMMSIVATGEAKRTRMRVVSLEADDLEALMYSWLNEIIFIIFSERFLPADFEVKKIAGTGLDAEIWGEEIRRGDRRLEMEIKGATFNELAVSENDGLWAARVIFDV